ncbi:MAG: hypothetical protein K5663_06875 [Clostridiales bacterium]|nr:hypothetical protein [Clostridiales bacterium]
MAKRIIALLISLLLALGPLCAFASTDKLEDALAQLNYYLTVFSDEERSGEISLEDIADSFMDLGNYSFANGFYQYSYILLCLERNDYRAADIFKKMLEKNTRFAEYLLSDAFREKYPAMGALDDLLSYVDARIAENNGNTEKAIELYQNAGFFDSTNRVMELMGGESSVRYQEALALMQAGDYKSAFSIFKELSEYGYENSKDYADFCQEMMAGEVTPEWSEWVDKLPEDVNKEKYEIETMKLYRSRVKQTKTDKQKGLKGWKLVGSSEQTGGFGAWSNWSAKEVKKSSTREVETRKMYRYRDLEKKTSLKSTMDGWTKYDSKTTYSAWGAWSNWSTNQATKSITRDVNSKTQYSARSKQYTTSTSSSLSGWTRYDSKTTTSYGSWSGWSTTAVSATSTRDVETKVVNEPTYATKYHYRCYNYYNTNYGKWYQSYADTSGNSWSTSGSWVYYDSFTRLTPGNVYDGYQSYTGAQSKIWFYETTTSEQNGTKAVTYYRYRSITRSTTYYYWKWGNWTDWADTKPSGDEFSTRTVYQYRDRKATTTYYFQRWGDWSKWSTSKVSANDERKVQTTTWYRYRDKITETVYFFERWGNWSGWSQKAVEEDDNTQVEVKTRYRYRAK